MSLTKNIIAFFVASACVTAIHAAPSIDCKKAVTDVEKAICADENISLMDSVLDYIYKADLKISSDPLELKKSQLQWMSKRPSNAEILEKTYRFRIQELLSTQTYFNNVVKIFFKQYDDSIKTWTHTNTLYDGMANGLVGAVMTCILDRYPGMKVSLIDPENFRDRQASSLFKLESGKYLFFYCHSMAAYNGEYTAWLISFKDSKFAATRLKIPEYDLGTKTVKFDDFVLGFVVFDEKTQIIQTHYKGVGYGGFSTDRFLRLVDDHFVLLKQEATKDNYDQTYELKGTDDDWVLEYESKTKNKKLREARKAL